MLSSPHIETFRIRQDDLQTAIQGCSWAVGDCGLQKYHGSHSTACESSQHTVNDKWKPARRQKPSHLVAAAKDSEYITHAMPDT